MVLRRAWSWLSLCLVIAGCAAPAVNGEAEKSTASHEKVIARSDVMARAQEWVDQKVPYCGGVRGGGDAICGGTCSRAPAAWDGYRSDCSGFVSWAWQIPDDPTTYVYIDDRDGDDGWSTVAIADLQPGDALVSDTHIKLFSAMAGDHAMEIYEESDCGLVAMKNVQDIVRHDGTTFTFSGDGRTYHGIRRHGISGTAGANGANGSTVGEGSQAFTFEGQQHYFSRSANGDLAHAWWEPSDRQVHHDVWANGLAGDPATFVTGTQQHVFARSASGALEHWFWDKATNEIAHDTWGTGIASDPTAILMGGGQHAFAVDAAGKLQHWFWVDGKGVQHDTWGDGVEGRPTVLEVAPDQHVFARGTSGKLEHFWWEPQGGVHHDTWADAIASEPAARNINGDQHVFAVDASGTLQHWWWGPTTKVISHDTWGASGQLDPKTRPSLFTHALDQHVFARGTGGTVEHYFWSPDKGVTHDTWGSGIASDPTAILIGDDEHVFARAPAGDLQHWWWSAKTNITHDTW